MKKYILAVFLAAFCLPVLAEEVDGGNLTAEVNACDYEPAKGKLYKTKTGKTLDCRSYYVMSLYGSQGYEGNVSMGMDPEAMCRGTIYYCEYIGNGKFKRSPINLSYVRNQCQSDRKLIGVRFEAVNGSYAASKIFASRRLSHQCPGEVEKPKPDDDKKPKPDDDKKPKPDDDKKPKPDDDKKPKPDDDKKPKPDDDKPKPDDDKKPKPDDSKNDKSMEDLLRRINDSLDRLNKNIENSGSGIPGGNGGGGSGGNGGSGNGGGSGGSGGGNGGGSGGGNGSGNGQSGGKDGENGGRCKGDDKNTLGCLTRDDLLGNSSSGDSDDFLPKKEVRLKFNLDNFLGSERLECPKPKVLNLRFYKITLSYEWLCDVLRNIRGVVIMVFSLSGVMFVLKGFK